MLKQNAVGLWDRSCTFAARAHLYVPAKACTCTSIYLSIYLSIDLSFYIFLYIYIYMYMYISRRGFDCVSPSLRFVAFVCLCIHLFTFPACLDMHRSLMDLAAGISADVESPRLFATV